jgi:hypothetical protein
MIPGSSSAQFFGAAGAAGGGYEIERSLRFNSSDSAYLSRTPASAGNRRGPRRGYELRLVGAPITCLQQ